MIFWPRTLVGRNLVLLVSLTIASQLCAIIIFVWYIQRPRVDSGAALEVTQIMLVGRLLTALPQAERERQILTMNSAAGVVPDDKPPASAATGGLGVQRFLRQIRGNSSVSTVWTK